MKPLKIFQILTFLLSFQFSYTQSKEAYFEKIIDTTANKQLKLNSLDSLIHNPNNQPDLNKFAKRTEQYVNLAIVLQEYEKAANFAIRAFYNINDILGQRNRALKLIEKVEKYKDKIYNSYILGGIYLKKGGGYFNGKDFNEAIKNYTLAIKNYSNKDSIYKADAIFFRGQAYFEIGNHIKAIDDYSLAAKYYENLGDKDYTFYTKSEIINIYGINGFDKKTIKEREKLINEKLKINYTNGLQVDYYNLAINYGKIGNEEKKEEYLLKSLEYQQKTKNEFDNSPEILAGLSLFYADKDLQKSEFYLKEADKAVAHKDKETLEYLSYEFSKATFLYEKGELNEALLLSKKLLKSYKESNNIESLIKTNELVYKIYKAKDDAKNALEYYQNYNKIKDSIYNVTKTNALSYYQTLYETEHQENEIEKQQASIVSLAEKNETKKRFILFGGIGLLLAFVVFFLYRNRIQLKKKQEMQEKFSQQLLLSQEQERKRISKDLHDSLGQSLLLIKNKVSLKKDEQTQELVDNAIEEMRGIARVLHPFQLEDIGISKALENLIYQLDQSYEDIYIFGNIEDLERKLHTNKEINVFRIVQECLSNIIKHAHAASAKIDLIVIDNHVNLSIKDNGVGFDFSEKYNDFKSLGLKTIKERVRFLNGVLKIDSQKNKGTTFNISFPL